MKGPCTLYLVRHGLAEERGRDWPDDTKRPLTREGIDRMKDAGRGLRRLGADVDVVLTSPLVRARQTADALVEAFEEAPPSVVVVDSLTPEGTVAAVLRDIEKHVRASGIALVGHEPNMGELAARLAGLRLPLEFKKGSVCRIDVKTFPVGPGKLRWFLWARHLAMIRK